MSSEIERADCFYTVGMTSECEGCTFLSACLELTDDADKPEFALSKKNTDE